MSIFSVTDLDTVLLSELNCYDLSALRATLSLIKTNRYYQNLLKQNSIYFFLPEAIFLCKWYLSKDWTTDQTMDLLMPILMNQAISEEYLLMALTIAEEKEVLYVSIQTLLMFESEQGQLPVLEKYRKRKMELLKQYADVLSNSVDYKRKSSVTWREVAKNLLTIGVLATAAVVTGIIGGRLFR